MGYASMLCILQLHSEKFHPPLTLHIPSHQVFTSPVTNHAWHSLYKITSHVSRNLDNITLLSLECDLPVKS